MFSLMLDTVIRISQVSFNASIGVNLNKEVGGENDELQPQQVYTRLLDNN